MKRIFAVLPVLVAWFGASPDAGAQVPSFTTVATTGFAASTNVMRRDPSDIIHVGDRFYLWYTKGDRVDGYDSTVWYATSTNGIDWAEQGECVPRGADDEWDAQSAFTPNILVASNRYWLFYTGVPKPFTNDGNQVTFSAIGAAVADSPDGPWTKLTNNPLLVTSPDTNDFDSMRVDDSVLMVRDGTYWLYYKGRQWNNTPANTKLGVAIAPSPEGPYVKYEGNPVFPGGHEMMAWPVGSGVMALITSGGNGMLYAADGLNFTRVMSLSGLPFAAGFYRPEAFTDSGLGEPPPWGMQIINGTLPILPTIGRVNCNWFGLGALPEAGLIQWESAFFTSGNANLDVRTNGVLVEAVNLGPASVAPLTVNGVPFSTGSVNAVLASSFTGALTNSGTLTPAYSNLLNTLAFGGGQTNSFLIGSGALVPGQSFLFQAWFADNRQLAGRTNLGMRLSGEATTNFVNLRSGFAGSTYGQYAVGIFTATGTSQHLFLRTDNSLTPQMGNLHLNAYQIRQLSGNPPILPPWRSFHIGNSLTQHSYPDGIELMLAARGFSNAWAGYHVNCGSSLINTWNNPTQSGCPGGPVLDPASGFSVALTNSDWAALAVQPFKPLASSSTLGTDQLAITQLVATLRRRPQNQDSPVYLYATHHMTNDSINKSFPATWTQAVVDADATTTIQARAYFDLLHSRLDALLDQPTREIPLGEVLYHFDLRAKTGLIPGYTNAYQLYTDHVHLNNLGAYISGCTTFATLTGQDPWGTAKPAGYYGAGFSADVFAAVQDLIWDVIEANPRARPIWHSDEWPEGLRVVDHFGDAIVRTNGVLVQAVNLGTAAGQMVNGVWFEGRPTYGGLTNAVASTNLYTNGVASAALEGLLDAMAMAHGYVSNVPHSAAIALTGLVAGARYEAQFLVSEMRSTAGKTRRQTFTLRGRSPYPAQSGIAYSLVCSFTATGSSESVSIYAELGNGETFGGVPTLNAFQLRRVKDYDGDGLDDLWELEQTAGATTNGVGALGLLSSGPGADFDGDGMSDEEEYHAGTQASDSGSVFRLESIAPVADGMLQFQWHAVPSNGAGRPVFYELLSVNLTGSPPYSVLAAHTASVTELVSLAVSNEQAVGHFSGRIQTTP